METKSIYWGKEHGVNIIDKYKINYEDHFDVVFPKYETKDEISEILSSARLFYNRLKKNKKDIFVLPTKVSSTYYYQVTYDKVVYNNGRPLQDSGNAYQNNLAYDEVFYKIFKKRLETIAKRNNSFVDVSVQKDDELETCYVYGELYTKEEFESKYGYPLDYYYRVKEANDKFKGISKKDEFIRELLRLKKFYMKNVITDMNTWNNLDMLRSDAYQAYLMIAYKYVSVENKEEILKKLGFELDVENRLLDLKQEKAMELLKK